MRFALVLIVTFLFRIELNAEPHVAGYHRFHQDVPSAAGGAILFSELGCANCHGGSAVIVPRKGPSLESLSSRVKYDWLIGFLKDPESGRKGSTMPHLTHGMSHDEVKAMAAYLSTQGRKLTFQKPRHANAEKGSALYHEKGCVACHAPTLDYQGPTGKGIDLVSPNAVSHPDFKAKTNLFALEHFLSNTSRYRADGRMPHSDLGREGALNVAAHLLDYQGSDPRTLKLLKPWPKASPELISQGKKLIEAASCAACHDLPGIERPKLISLRDHFERGNEACLSANPKKGLPRYQLSDHQKESLVAFLKEPSWTERDKATLTLKAMNCYVCHDRDGLGGPTQITRSFFHGDESLGDSGKLPPPLTGIGHKLRKDWLQGVLAGDPKKRVRSYLKTVMPSYPRQAQALADCLAQVDAQPRATKLVEVGEANKAGRQLLGTQGGVSCITCHQWGKKQSLGIPALDLSTLDQRLRPEWFRSYLLNPASYRPGTLMPSLWPNGRSAIPDILGGDTEKQISAIWDFIAKGQGDPEGFPEKRSGQFELVPTDRPIIQRTFLEGGGAKAILVGFPGEIHIAFDGLQARPALVWKGAFFDAYNTWFTRAAPFEKPLGEEVSTFPKIETKRRFRGYELDANGNPTFLYFDAGRLVRERFEVKDGTLLRVVSWPKGNAPKVNHPPGLEVTELKQEKTMTVVYRWK